MRVDPEQVAGRPRHEDVGAEELAELADEVLERRLRGARRLLAPEGVEQAVGRDGAAGLEEQDGEERPLLGAPEREGDAVSPHLERAEEPEVKVGVGVLPAHGPVLAPFAEGGNRPLAARWRRVTGRFGPRLTVAA